MVARTWSPSSSEERQHERARDRLDDEPTHDEPSSVGGGVVADVGQTRPLAAVVRSLGAGMTESLIAARPHHVLWKHGSKVHAIRPPRFAYETEYAGQTWCALYGSFDKTFTTTDEPLTCKTCAKGEAARVR